MSVANHKRGEIKIELGGKSFILTPTYRAMATIDGALREVFDDSTYTFDSFIQDIASGRQRLASSAAVIYGGIVGNNPRTKVTLEEVQEMVFAELSEGGYSKISDTCTIFGATLFRGGKPLEVEESSDDSEEDGDAEKK